MRIITLAILVLLGGCAAHARDATISSPRQDEAMSLAKELDGLTAGKPQSCITQSRTDYQTKTIGDTILYRVNKRLVYRTDAPGCSRAETGDALVSVNYGSQLCAGQIITTVNLVSQFQTGSCALGKFTPYTKLK